MNLVTLSRILTMSGLCMCAHAYRYRYQLEAFVDKVRGRDPEHWFDAQDSIANMEWIEAIYKEVSQFIMHFLVGLCTLQHQLTDDFSLTDRAGFSPSFDCRGPANDRGVSFARIGSMNVYRCDFPN
jgi:hypothetical protein